MLVRLIPPTSCAIEFAVGLHRSRPISSGPPPSRPPSPSRRRAHHGRRHRGDHQRRPRPFLRHLARRLDQMTAGFMLVLAIAADSRRRGGLLLRAALALIALIATTRYSTGPNFPHRSNKTHHILLPRNGPPPPAGVSFGRTAGSRHRVGNPLCDRLGGEADLLTQQRRLAVGHVAVGQPAAQDLARGSTHRRRPGARAPRHRSRPPARSPRSSRAARARPRARVSSGRVERLGEAGVGDRAVDPVLDREPVGRAERQRHAVAVADEGDALPAAQDLARARSRSAPARPGRATPSASPRG